jgi:hypothetical protein
MAKTNVLHEESSGELVPGKSLTLKWSPERPLTTEERGKLIGAVRLAIKLVPVVIRHLRVLAMTDVRSAYATSDVRPEILRYHFKLPVLDPAGAAWKTWRDDLTKIATGYQTILTGLTGPLVISDAYIKQLKSVMPRAEVMVMKAQLLSQKLQLQVDELTLRLQRMHARDALRPKLEAELQALRQGCQDAAAAAKISPESIADDSARNVGGFVRSRQTPKDGRALSDDEWLRHLGHNDPDSPRLLPQHKGAIHINFEVFLKDPQQRNLHVARTLIHEASHKFLDTYDFAYTHDPAYATINKAQAMRNADSYAFAAVSCYKARLFRDKMHMMQPSGDLDC